ncbi:CAP domain-containing protein [Streptomyces rhizosphaerihabitans]|uniref:CAP domain-containing protein n=1 Tax=Streptomyces rhizosphaerihabitans TaxID=1266770 RepID=UPI0021BF271B|nr:CAP domain-containing protein [Streptomyces rhizosphaerihabitans]MCT9007961.1 CAP domain-containing protein [Streptomyces rhizosphaerihabitans]
MSELVPGGNTPLPDGVLTLRVPGPFDVSALITDDSGKVRGDGDFVFYNQPAAPGARLDGDRLTVDPVRLRPGAARVTLVVSPADPATPLGRLPSPTLQVTGSDGRALARFTPPRPQRETVLLLAELYRRGTAWKLRALGQGYADGLAGVARDFGVEVTEDTTPSGATASAAPGGGPLTGRGTGPGAGRGAAPGTGQSSAPGAGTGAGPGAPGAGQTSATRAGRVTAPRTGGTSASAAGRLVPARGGQVRGEQVWGGPVGTPDGGPDTDGFLGPVNSARAAAGSPPVRLDARLTAAARDHAGAMAARGLLSSESPQGTSVYQRVIAAGYPYLTIGEHLVSGPRTPHEFVEYCLSSEQSRRTLCDPAFDQTGLACVPDARSGDLYWTALWARPFSPAGLERTAREVIALTNTERASAGLPPLSADATLTTAAQAHSADMVARDFYAHESPDGSRPWDRAAAAGCTRRSIGENIACGQRSPAEVVRGWMDSPGHRANILKRDFTHIGIGLAGGSRAGTYWTQLFGG